MARLSTQKLAATLLSFAVLCSSRSVAADTSESLPQLQTLDNTGLQESSTTVARTDADTLAPKSMSLSGSVTKSGHGDQPSLNGDIGRRSEDDKDKFKFLRARKSKMNSEDFRNLGFGITGFVSVNVPFMQSGLVVKVFPGCPAEQAGVRKGDHLVRANDHVFSRHDRQLEYWRILDGRAGTAVDCVFMRQGQPVTVHLVRMNIEDIAEPRLRRQFEHMVKTLGAPCD